MKTAANNKSVYNNHGLWQAGTNRFSTQHNWKSEIKTHITENYEEDPYKNDDVESDVRGELKIRSNTKGRSGRGNDLMDEDHNGRYEGSDRYNNGNEYRESEGSDETIGIP